MKPKTDRALLVHASLVGVLVLGSCQSVERAFNDDDSPQPPPAQVEAKTAEASAKTAKAPAPKPKNPALKSSMAFPTGRIETSAVLVEKMALGQATAGKPYGYEIVVTNLTGLALNDVQITEAFASNFELQSASPASFSKDEDAGRWNLGTLAPSESKVIRLQGVAKAPGRFDTCSTISYDSALCMSVDVIQPGLELHAAATPAALRCEDIAIEYTVTNPGTGTARDVVVKVELPKGLLTKEGRTSFSEQVGDLASGQSKRFRVLAKASERGTFEYVADARAADGLTAESGGLKTVVTEPVLQLSMTGTKESFANRSLTYQINVKNAGDGVARNLLVEETVPAGVEFVSASRNGSFAGGKIRWNLGTLAPGATEALEVKLRAKELGLLKMLATARADCAAPVQAPAETRIQGIPAILLEVIDLSDPIEVGAEATYLVTVTNQGTASGTNIEVICTMPSNVRYVSSTGATQAAVPTGNVVKFGKLPSLAPKQKATWRVVVRGEKPADARFKVSMQSDQLTSPVEETEATTFYE